MSYGYRKKAHVVNVFHEAGEENKIYLNDRPLEYYLKTCVTSASLLVVRDLFRGELNVYCQGGGLSSQVQLLEKVIFKTLPQKDQLLLKQKYPTIDRTDGRKRYPKRYGGRKSRARSQKSYR